MKEGRHSLLVIYIADFKNYVSCLIHLPLSFPLRFRRGEIKTSKKIPVLCYKTSEQLLHVIYTSESCSNTSSSCHIYQSERDL